MARICVGLSIASAPKILNEIIVNSLEATPGVDLVVRDASDPGGGVDVWIVAGLTQPQDLVGRSGVKRVIDIDLDGRSLTIHWKGHAAARIANFSSANLQSLVKEGLEKADPAAAAGAEDRAGCAPTIRELFSDRRRPLRAAVSSDRVRAQRKDIAGVLARLAAKALQRRAASRRGDDAEFAAFVRLLSEAAGGRSEASLPELGRMEALFSLTADERDLLFLCAAVEVEPLAARMLALLNDQAGRRWPTIAAAGELGMDTLALAERMTPAGPLLRYGLCRFESEGPVSMRSIAAHPDVWPLILGMDRSPPIESEILDEKLLDHVVGADALRQSVKDTASALRDIKDTLPVVAVAGDVGVGRSDIAKALAAGLRGRLLTVPGRFLEGEAAVGVVEREATLLGAAVMVTEQETAHPPAWRLLVQRLEAPLFVSVEPSRIGSLGRETPRAIRVVAAPARDLAQRKRLWAAHAPASWPAGEIDGLASRFDFGKPQIASALALAAAAVDPKIKPGPTIDDVHSACIQIREVDFDGLAERLDCPYTRDDIVLRPETESELELALAWSRSAGSLFGPDGRAANLRAGEGLACLFSGPPGCGKTLCAQILAAEAKYDFYRVDLSQCVDKFVGEGEKRIARLFAQAQRSRVALFLDEADAVCGKRTELRDSSDRWANFGVNVMLQELDKFSGLVVLATNLASSMDDAFLRRMRVRAEFYPPDAADRAKIWEMLLPRPPMRAADIRIDLLASFDLTGGEIRNAIYTAHLRATGSTPTMADCCGALMRELKKKGRIVDLAPLARWKRP
jgi:hypothetical protein